MGYHGSLTPWSCLIDRNWTLRLTDYGIANILEKWQKRGVIGIEALKKNSHDENDDRSAATQKTSSSKKFISYFLFIPIGTTQKFEVFFFLQ